MKTKIEVYEAIIEMEKIIHDTFPELVKFLDEMPATIPKEIDPVIDLEILKEYYCSLNELVLKYTHDKTKHI